MIHRLEELISYNFNNEDLIKEALTHKSYNSGRGVKHNERLEFLGDSVLGSVVADYIYNKRPDVEEGVLSKIKSAFVSRKNLYLWAAELDLGSLMRMGAGEESTGGRTRESILSNAMEAVLGAVYLDGGYEAVRNVVYPWAEKQNLDLGETDYKSALQEYYQKKGYPPPGYEILQTVGPEHDKFFTVAVSIKGEELARGQGKTKKLAEQSAAKTALDSVKNRG